MKIILGLFIGFMFLLSGCDNDPIFSNENKLTIGFSQCTMVDAWRKAMVEEMKREIVLYRDYNIELIVKDAQDDNAKQIYDINELMKSGIDILIVSPNEAEQLTPVVEEVYNRGIPVIVIDRKINSEKYTAFIGPNNLTIGREAGYFAYELLKGKGKVLEITGLKGSTPAIERSKGFREIVKNYPDITIKKIIEGDWLEDKTLNITDSLLRSFRDFDLIFAHNDFMAYAASKSSLKYNIKPYIIGIDGMNIPDGGVDMVINGQIDGTIYYPSGGDKAIQLAIDIISGNPFEKNTTLNTFRIDGTNARTIWLQGQQLQNQQTKIDKQSDQLNSMSSILKRRNSLLLLTSLTIFLLALTIIIIFTTLRNKNKMNKLLDEKNKTINQQFKIISKQRDESVNLLMVAEEAKENKLRLFTDLSHEFRTIATLITSPIKDLLNTVNDDTIKSKLRVLQRSSERLARLTDGILKFRNLDENKFHLVYVNANISDFIEHILEAFRDHITNKGLNLNTHIAKEIYAEFDLGVIEKVMYNLLSNAIKYTDKPGTISVTLKLEDFNVYIDVSDTGLGIPENELPLIFNRFHKINNPKKKQGTENIGIGLALCKEMIQLHGGLISATSKINEGTTFKIKIPQFHQINGSTALPSDELLSNIPVKNIGTDYKKTVLIVEDNPDVLILLADLISNHYKVITASNGKEALELANKKIPDLIVSDILMPVMDGMQLCIEIKKHIITCHIPVILLTAIDSQENIIKSFDLGADAYITKPFNDNLLLSNIRNLIESREKLKSSLCPSPFFRTLLESKSDGNETFIKDCINNIYENLENEDYSMTTLSQKMNMSRSTLYRRIKEVAMVKPVDFIKKAKLNYAAKLLLKETGYNVNEISWRSGFNDPKYFSKCFQQEFGINPSHYSRESIVSMNEPNQK